jgi:hypothetical protein
MWASGAMVAIARRLNSSRLVIAGMAVMMVLATAGFLVGRGESALRLHVKSGEAWLPTDKNGSVNLVDGIAGRSSAALVLKGAAGDKLIVVQVGGRILVLNATTGLLVRIDPVQLLLGATQRLSLGSVVVAGLAATYIVNYAARTVQRIDPVTLRALGPTVMLRWQPSGTAVVDKAGTLWVPVPSIGSVVPVAGGSAGHPVKVSAVGANVVMTTANGLPIAVDRTGRRLTLIGLNGRAAQNVVTLPASVGRGGPNALLVPLSGSSSSLPMVDENGTPSLVIVNLSQGTTTNAQLGAVYAGNHLGAPVQAGARVFIPDYTTGQVVIYNTVQGQIEANVPVLGHAGFFTAEVVDGIAYFNNPNGNQAVVVTPDGQVHNVTKNGPHVPHVRSVAPPQTTPTPINTQPGPSPSPTHGKRHHRKHHKHKPKPKPSPTKSKSPTPTPTPTKTPSPTPTPTPSTSPAGPPLAPAYPQATAGPGYVDVSWQTPTSGGPIKSYQVAVSPAGGTQSTTGPTSVRISNLTCGTSYQFTVSSVGYSGPPVAAAPVSSKSCVLPGPPQGLSTSFTQHQITLNWSPSASDGGGTVTYTYTVNGGSSVPLSGSPFTIAGLTNFATYTVAAQATNGAGTATASTSVTLAAGPWTYNTTNSIILNVRSGPDTGSASVGTLPPNGATPVVIVCQTTGGPYYEPGSGIYRGNIWDEIEWNGGVAYVGDFYITTPNAQSETYSWPPLWSCS